MFMSRFAVVAIVAAVTSGVLAGVATTPAGAAFSICDPNVTNPCPHAVADTFKATFNTKLAVAAPGVLVNDSGPAGTTVDTTSGLTDTQSFAGATVAVKADGSFTYTPDKTDPFSGLDAFTYAIVDPDGDTSTALVTVQVNAVVANDSYTVAANQSLTVHAPGVLANDIGVDHLSEDIVVQSAHHAVVNDLLNGAFQYIPPHNFTGADTFTYTVQSLDDTLTYHATVTVRVGAGAPPPPPPPASVRGYWMVGSGGHVYPFGQLKNYGNANTFGVTHIEPTPSRHGYWILNTNGQVFAFGDAKPFGGAGSLKPGETASSLSATPTGKGYWIFTNRGRVFARGDAHNFGDMRGVTLNGPIVGSSATPTGKGYWMVGTDGGIFSFGDAHFYGSTGNIHLNKPVNGLVPTPNNHGYWLVASDGGIFAFGNAGFHGSMGGTPLNRPIIGMVRYGNGYLMVSSDGGIFAFSNLPFLGSLANNPPAIPIVGVASGG